MLGAEPLVLCGDGGGTRTGGVVFGGPQSTSASGPFHGVSRPLGQGLNLGRQRGGKHAREGWAGSSPNEGSAAGCCNGRVICDG